MGWPRVYPAAEPRNSIALPLTRPTRRRPDARSFSRGEFVNGPVDAGSRVMGLLGVEGSIFGLCFAARTSIVLGCFAIFPRWLGPAFFAAQLRRTSCLKGSFSKRGR